MDDKKRIMRRIEETERALMDLSQWKIGKKITKMTEKITGPIENEEQRDRMIPLLRSSIAADRAEKKNLDLDKLYLSEIVDKEKPKFEKNNLILAPVGSGKTHLIKKLIKHESVLLLVSTTSLKDRLVPNDESERTQLGNRMYSTSNENIYGKGDYKILVMTYAEFGNKIKYSTDFAMQFNQIFCDEIHSLENYQTFTSSDTLLVTILFLFSKNEIQQKFYFTATTEHLNSLKKKANNLFEDIKVFDYLQHPEIRKYMPLSSYSITGIEQVRSHLRARKESFRYFDYKSFAFCKTIGSMKRLRDIAKEEGFNPIVLWSINNLENPLDDEQEKMRNYILATGLIPNQYDMLIVNSAMQEGWDLIDDRVKLVIMNTTNETESIQATGRIRKDIDILVYRVKSGEPDYIIDLSTDILDKKLDSSEKEKLAKELNIDMVNGRKAKWPTIKKILQKQGFVVKDETVRENNKQKRVSIISIDK